MSADRTPWSTEVDRAGDRVVVRVMLSLDAGPMREFRPFLDVELDEAHATELLGKLSLALHRPERRLADADALADYLTVQANFRDAAQQLMRDPPPRPDREQ